MQDLSYASVLDLDAPPRTVARAGGAANGVLPICAALILIGIVMVFSTATQLAPPKTPSAWWNSTAARQTAFSLAGLVVMLVVSRIDYRFWRGHPDSPIQPPFWLLVGTMVLLAAVLVPGIGVERNGARRWLNLGSGTSVLSFQPSELAKPALVLFLAAFCAQRGAGMKRLFTGLLPALAVLGACVGLVGKEDFGTAALLAAAGGGVLWCSRASRRQIVWLAGPTFLAALLGLFFMKTFRFNRVIGFLTYWDDPQGKGYHPIQSLIAIASGGVWGRGLGGGIQKYGYLPEARSDFVFAVICEELGIVGAVGIIALFIALIWQGHRAARRAPDEFGRLLALGGTLLLGLQAVINIGVVTVSLPTKGIALPFVSTGGSGVLLLGFLAGLIAAVGRAGIERRAQAD